MRSLFAVWLITLFSLTNLSAVRGSFYFHQNSSCHSEGAFCATEESRLEQLRFFAAGSRYVAPAAPLLDHQRLRMTSNQDEPPITAEEYWERVRNTRQAILELEAKPEADVRAGLDDLASQWEQVREVELSDQNVIQIDSSYLVNELRIDPPDLKRLQNLLEALSRAHEEYPQKVFTIQDVEPLREILARPEFQWEQVLEMPSWLASFNDWMERIRNRILSATFQYGRVPLIIAGMILFAISLYFISKGLSRNLVREAELAAQGGDSDTWLTSKGAMQRAQTLSGQGDYRNAIRYLYLSSLLVLDEQGLLRYDRSRTNREVLRSVSAKPDVAEPLRDVIDVFDRVWYGFEPVDETTYQSYVKHVDELREKKE